MPEELAHVWQAFNHLRHDRTYGAMGGVFPMPFAAIDAYAARLGLGGDAFWQFRDLLAALDDEFVRIMEERAREEAERRKAGRGGDAPDGE